MIYLFVLVPIYPVFNLSGYNQLYYLSSTSTPTDMTFVKYASTNNFSTALYGTTATALYSNALLSGFSENQLKNFYILPILLAL